MIRAYIREQWGFSNGGGSLAIDIVREVPHEDGGRPRRWILILGPDGAAEGWQEATNYAEIKPTLLLGPDESAALCLALNNHYQGVDDQRALRKDYDAERGRVDKLTDALIGLAGRRD
jgi:hypothetical protein